MIRTILGILALASPALAGGKTIVFPLAGAPAMSAPITRALAASIDAEVSAVSIEDAAGLLDCDPETSACLEAVGTSTGAEHLVFGSVAPDANAKLKVVLTRFDPGPEREQRSFLVTGLSARAAADELVTASAGMFGREAPVVVHEEPDPIVPLPSTQLPPQTRPRPSGIEDAEVTGGSWAMLSVGLVAAAVGVGFHIAAHNVATEYDQAPAETRPQIEHLLDLETRGRRLQTTGWVLVASGGVLALIGATRAAVQSQSRPTQARASLAMTPISGGAALVFTGSFR